MKAYHLLVLTVIVLFTASCSSAPKKSEEVNTRKNRAADFMEFGNQYFKQGHYGQALIFFNMALDENIAADFESGISKVKSSIGRTYLLLENLTDAEKYINEGYKLAKELDNKDLIALSSNYFAELYLAKNLLPEADKYISESMMQVKANSTAQAEAYHTLAIVERKKGNPEKAMTTINKAIEINKQNKAHSNLGANYYLLASFFSQDNNYIKANEMLNLAIKHDRIEENSYGIAKDYKALGLVAIKNNKKEEAYSFFIKSLDIFKVINNTQEEKNILKLLVDLSLDLGKTSDSERFKARLKAI